VIQQKGFKVFDVIFAYSESLFRFGGYLSSLFISRSGYRKKSLSKRKGWGMLRKGFWFSTPHGLLSYTVDTFVTFISMLLPNPKKTVFIYNHYRLIEGV